ncbi:MAG: DNA polymerase IV [Candidatus Pacearchaeota archaeon]
MSIRQTQDSTSRIILHIDFDSFFASVEQQYDPKLRGRPMGVTAQNGRTCIIASSREAKKLGIKTGSRSYDAFKIYPQLILVPADFAKYWKISKKFLNICKDYSPYVEVFSIDEVFIDVTKTAYLFKNVNIIVQEIKERIRKEIGEYITASFGISHNKLLAKLASGINKPDGVFEINSQNINKIYQKAKLTDICGIGERIKARLNQIGVQTIFDLRKISHSILFAEFGNAKTQFLKNIAFGIDESEVIPYTLTPEVKSIGRNYCLPQNEYNKRKVLQNVYELWEEVCIKLRKLNKKARTLGFDFRGNINIFGRKTYSFYFDNVREIRPLFQELLAKNNQIFNSPSSYIRQIRVWVGSLEEKNNVPLSLFEEALKRKSLTNIIYKINDKFGDHTIRTGFLLYSEKLTTVPNGYMADKYERTKLAQDEV